ncbi:MAG: S8 family serine peptidase, partial [Anaerohalosphaera sp.]|nr:S8 family serine peptidase [Anaerohalosphaera sp.]
MKSFASIILAMFVSISFLSFTVQGETVAVDPNGPDQAGQRQAVELEGEIFDIITVNSDDLDEEHQQLMAQGEVREAEPVISRVLARKLQWLGNGDITRVIIHLDKQISPKIARQVRQRYQREIKSSQDKIKKIHDRYKIKRNARAEENSGKDRHDIIKMNDEDYLELRSINESIELLEYEIKSEIRETLIPEITDYQQSVVEVIESLGGTVENQTTEGDAIIASVPAGIIGKLSNTAKIRRIVEDGLKDSHLNNSDNATLVASSLNGGGLWDNGQTGGAYDPAVLDSGTDLDHPALKNSASRTNFYSWYLTAASGNSDYDDASDEDDRQGHGTHVMGIVSSYGSTGYTNNLGMAFGVSKAVTLKAGFLKTTGKASMYDSDAMSLVNRALHQESSLRPSNTFNDDVDGINLSYGGLVDETTNPDETDYSRFWDSVISGDPGLVVTISAGNDGPTNPRFANPACAYNPITVANVYDGGTVTRSDDVIRSSSTRGPTANGRKKPDIAAPGSYIMSCNNDWEGTTADFISKSGTSMSAPMVLGVTMDLMDAGVTNYLDIKALLINTAQKNNTAINFESDIDGWSETYGWGYMNAWAAYYHRSDTHSGTLTERNTEGSYHLYKGRMRDENIGKLKFGDGGLGSNEGRDRATLVWNRHAQYKTSAYPTNYDNLSDLNLRLYKETNNFLIDSDLTSIDNVHQVRVNALSAADDFVVKVYAWSLNFPHGGTTEDYSLATEDDFVKVDLPKQFGSSAIWPSEMEPSEEKQFEIWIHNTSDLASHNNTLDLVLPAGWSRVSGPDPANLGTIEADGQSIHVTWTLRAQSTLKENAYVRVYLSHNSYGESWDDGATWVMPVDVRWDNTSPTPTPMSFSSAPLKQGTSSIAMTASYASDIHGPVEYFFDFYNSPTSGTGGSNSAWQTSRYFTDSYLQPNHQYGYRVRARDNATTKNLTAYSGVVYEITDIETPTGITFGTATATSLQVRSTNTPTNLNLGNSGLEVRNITTGSYSGWKHNNNYWTSGSLNPNALYQFHAKARNISGEETGAGPIYGRYTLAVSPRKPAISNITKNSFDVAIGADANPSYT